MKTFQKLTALAVCGTLILSLSSCADFGVGENADAFKEYFSGVYVLSKKSAEKYSIEEFNGDISLDDTDIPVVIPYGEYSYIGFRVDKQYTVSVSEFAFFAKTESGTGELYLNFYVVDTMPTSIKGDSGDVEIPSLDEDESISDSESFPNDNESSDGEIPDDANEGTSEDDLFVPENKFYSSVFQVGEEWDSVLLQFDGAKTVNAGQYIVVRINNNCVFNDAEKEGEEEVSSVSFTFNYLLFYFTDAHKN